jgi:hypothetical protein
MAGTVPPLQAARSNDVFTDQTWARVRRVSSGSTPDVLAFGAERVPPMSSILGEGLIR